MKKVVKTEKAKMREVEIDASGKRLGRLASTIAATLRGKDRSDFARNVVPSVAISVKNAGKIILDEKRKDARTYTRYTGYPGGLYISTQREISERKGGQAKLLEMAVKGMLPGNKLKDKLMRNLTINN